MKRVGGIVLTWALLVSTTAWDLGLTGGVLASGAIVLPDFPRLLGVELIRGMVYVGAMTPFIGVMAGRRWRAGLQLGVCLAIFGGLAPLLLPVDDVLPAEVRRFHMLEIGISNFLFGLVSAALLVRPGRHQAEAVGDPVTVHQ